MIPLAIHRSMTQHIRVSASELGFESFYQMTSTIKKIFVGWNGQGSEDYYERVNENV